MIKVGYIDDVLDQFENYERKLRRYQIELLPFEVGPKKADYIDQIYKNQVEVLLIDYKMASTVGFNGSALISYINDEIPDMTCFILTSAERTHITDKLVIDNQIYSKEIFDTEADNPEKIVKFNEFVAQLKNCAEVYRSRRELKCKEYEKLLDKKRGEELSIPEEEEFCRLYHALSSYGMVEKLSDKLLQSNFEERLDNILRMGSMILQKE